MKRYLLPFVPTVFFALVAVSRSQAMLNILAHAAIASYVAFGPLLYLWLSERALNKRLLVTLREKDGALRQRIRIVACAAASSSHPNWTDRRSES